MDRWMALFVAASAAFASEDVVDQLHDSQPREMESSRAVFAMLLLGVCENPTVLQALSRPSAKGEPVSFPPRACPLC